jgi:hypothetical protein
MMLPLMQELSHTLLSLFLTLFGPKLQHMLLVEHIARLILPYILGLEQIIYQPGTREQLAFFVFLGSSHFVKLEEI